MPGESRKVTPHVDVLPISDGDTLTVRRRLNTGEERAKLARAVVEGPGGARILDGALHRRSTVIAYLLDSTVPELVGAEDKSPDEIGACIDALDPDDYKEIAEAIEAHVGRVQAARDVLKNGKDGAKKSSATSPSPDGSAAGDSTGSESSTPTTTT